MSENWVQELQAEAAAHIDKLIRHVKRNLISQGEMECQLRAMQNRMWNSLTRENRCGYHCSAELTVEQWRRLQADYALWQRGEICNCDAGSEWIVVDNRRNMSLAQIKKEFFDIRNALCLGIAEFTPVPASIEKPASGLPIDPGTLRCMEFASDDLSALLKDPQASVGKSFVFALDRGVELRMRVDGIQKPEGREDVVLKCKGYISDYMMPVEHEIEIDRSTLWFSYLSDEDVRFFYNSPRFQPYIEFRTALDKRAMEETMQLLLAHQSKLENE